MRRTILHLLSPAPFGGLESVVESLAIGQRAAGTDVGVAVLVQDGDPDVALVTRLRNAGVPVHQLSTAPRRHDVQRRLVLELLGDLRPDVLHSHGYVGDVMAWLARGRAGVSHVTTVHGFTGGGARNRLYEWLQCRSLRGAAAVVAVSAKLAKDLILRRVPKAAIHVIPNAWTPPAIDREHVAAPLRESDACAIGWVGRISREKGLDVLIDALPLLPMREWTLTIVGDGHERASLESRVRASALADRVTWMGAVDSAGDYIAGFDILVISSRTEGTPMTLLEAMSAGTSIVTTRVGGIPDVVSEREAWLVEAENPAALAATIAEACGDPAERRARVRAARERLDAEFAPAPWLARYDNIYDTLTARRPRVTT